MGQVTVTLNGRAYRLSCGEGEEARLLQLAAHIEGMIAELASEFGQVGDDRLLVMAALMITDELFDLRRELGETVRDWDTHRVDLVQDVDDDASITDVDPGFASATEKPIPPNPVEPPVAPGSASPRRDNRRTDGRPSLEDRLAAARTRLDTSVRLNERKPGQ